MYLKKLKLEVTLSHHFQRLQESAKIRVNECEYTKNWKNVFADVCIFYFCLYILFLTAASFADSCIFSVPPPSLGIVSVPHNWMNIR